MEILVVVLVVLLVTVFVIPSLFKGAGQAGTYKARQFMTDNEAEFFGRLVVALPDHYVFPQVAMTALIESAASNKKKAHSDRLRIAQQRVDYVVCDRRCQVVAVVELDDQTHSRNKDKIRDERLQQGGFRTVRFQSKSKPSPEALRAAILSVHTVPGVTKSGSAS